MLICPVPCDVWLVHPKDLLVDVHRWGKHPQQHRRVAYGEWCKEVSFCTVACLLGMSITPPADFWLELLLHMLPRQPCIFDS